MNDYPEEVLVGPPVLKEQLARPSLTPKEITWLNNISTTDEAVLEKGDPIFTNNQIQHAYDELRPHLSVGVSSQAREQLKRVGISQHTLDEALKLMGRYRYDQPLKYLERLKKYPVVVGESDGDFVAVLPEYHDVHGVGDGTFVYGNCALLAKHYSFQLHILDIFDTFKREAGKEGYTVDLLNINGKCTDLFNSDGSNHWYCVFDFIRKNDSARLVFDPSFQRVATMDRYQVSGHSAFLSVSNQIPRETSVSYSPLDLTSLTYPTTAFACSYNRRLSYGLSFHEYMGALIPVFTVFRDTEDGSVERCDIFVNPQTGRPMCDRSRTTQFSLAERIEIVQCLDAIQGFRIVRGDVKPILHRPWFNFAVNE